MIDLRNKSLPDTVNVNGRDFKIYTDFRVWLEFGEKIKNPKTTLYDLGFVFIDFDDVLKYGQNYWSALTDFFFNPNATPNDLGTGGSDDTIFDYILDGEYIYASFVQCYGIDLLEVDMHWHKFKALFSALSEDTKMSKIMGYRAYKTPSKNSSADKEYKRLKRMWSLDERITEEEKRILEEFNSL